MEDQCSLTDIHNHDFADSIFGHLGEVALQLRDLVVVEPLRIDRLDDGGRREGVVVGALDVKLDGAVHHRRQAERIVVRPELVKNRNVSLKLMNRITTSRRKIKRPHSKNS